MPTPTNSVLNRDDPTDASVSKLIYENESYKIEIMQLKGQLESAGFYTLEDLKKKNDALQAEVGQLRVQLQEKEAQLGLYQTSTNHFSTIDASLHELVQQIQNQRAEIADMRTLTREKEEKIASLTVRLQDSKEVEEDLEGARECIRELEVEVRAKDTLVERTTAELTEVRAALTEARKELAGLSSDAAAKSRVKGDRMTEQEAELAAAKERESAAQQLLADTQATLQQAQEERDALRTAQVQAKEAAPRVAATTTGRVDIYAPEVKAHVEKQVKLATESAEERLRQLVEQNASLLSRMALVQQESEAMMLKKGATQKEVVEVKERVDMLSRRKDARCGIQRRVEMAIKNGNLSKEDIQRLLQEMLDYQEEVEQEHLTLLTIKDLQSEERERALRVELKRVKDENTSLLKQLQEIAMERHVKQQQRAGSTQPSPSPAHTPQRESGPSAAPSIAPGPTPAATGLPPAGRPPIMGGDLWSNTPAARAPPPQQAQPRRVDPHAPVPAAAPRATAAGDEARNRIVRCPGCTYEQRYGNRKCEICDTELSLDAKYIP